MSQHRLWRFLADIIADPLAPGLPARAGRLTEADWLRLIQIANTELVSAELAIALRKGLRPALPVDVGDYLARLLAANGERNDLLRRQCIEIGSIARGRRVVVLKGATWLFGEVAERRQARMMQDLDLLIAAADVEMIERELMRIGYRVHSSLDEVAHYHRPVLVHPERTGAVELHIEVSYTPRLLSADEILRQAEPVGHGLHRPAPRHRVMHNVLHSQKLDGAWWAGVVPLRQTLDLHRLMTDYRTERVDWEQLAEDARRRGTWQYLTGAIHTAGDTFGSPLPAPLRSSWAGRSHAARCRLQRMLPANRMLHGLGFLARALSWDRDAFDLSHAGFSARRIVALRRLYRVRRRLRTLLRDRS